MFFSIIVAFRNRDLGRVRHALNSIDEQSYNNFEVIFIDYGSDEEVASKTQQLVGKYSFCKYYYSDTRGWFWNRAHALNTGIRLATGDVIVLYDIDLIIAPDFLLRVSSLNLEKKFYTFTCFYLPEDFDASNSNVFESGIYYHQNYVGLCAVQKQQLVAIQGLDEYYMVWGVEDDDLYSRLTGTGLERIQVTTTDFPVFHQWHAVHAPSKPSLWYLVMVDYLYSKEKSRKIDNWGAFVRSENRPAKVGEIEKGEGCLQLDFLHDNNLLFFNPFIDQFHRLGAGAEACIYYKFKNEGSGSKPTGRQLPSFFNRKIIQDDRIKKSDVIDFFQLFVGIHRSDLKDYYFQHDSTSMNFCFVKA